MAEMTLFGGEKELHSYRAYDLSIHSTLPLPELVPGKAEADVVVRFGETPPPQRGMGEASRLVSGTAQEVHLCWKDVGTFLVRNGREIVVDPAPGVEECVLRLFILGSALGVLLLQRGLTVFHASVVTLSSASVAFLGQKGNGKSTVAAALHTRGHTLVADDIMALSDDGRSLIARPGFPLLKLWPASVEAIGEDPESLPLLRPESEKRAHRISRGFAENPTPLRGVYVLDSSHEIEIVPLKPREALMRVLPHWYGAMFSGELLDTFGLGSHLHECARLVNSVPVYLLRAPTSLDTLPDVAQAVERHVLGERAESLDS